MPPEFEVIRFQAEAHFIEFLRAKSFAKAADKIFTKEEISGFMNYIAANPEAGVKMPGTSGLRKMRWRAKGFGKSGGVRIIYYFRDLNMPLLLLAVYAKNECARLTVEQTKEIDRKVDKIVSSFTEARRISQRSADRRA